MLLYGATRYRAENLRIEPCIPCQLVRIHVVALAVAVRDRPQLAHVGDKHLVAELFADSDRMHAGLHRHLGMRHVDKPLLDRLRRGSAPTSINHLTSLVESAVMAPHVVAEVYADRQLYLSTLQGCFCDEVVRWLLHGIVCASFGGPALPIYQEQNVAVIEAHGWYSRTVGKGRLGLVSPSPSGTEALVIRYCE